MLNFLKRFFLGLGIFILILTLAISLFLRHPLFGAAPSGARLERILKSPNYRDGQFQNLSPTPQMTGRKPQSFFHLIWKFLTQKTPNLTPDSEIPSIKTDLKNLDPKQNILVWLGHSAYFMQLDGKKFLVDPTLISGSPVPFINKPFKWASAYQPEDIPDLDYLIITHDHYDHLDYYTIKEIKDRVWHFIAPLWVWAHLERRGVNPDQMTELDRNEAKNLNSDFVITALPARHFSGRTFNRNNTLRASFMLQTPSETIYIGGDSGYDAFYQSIGQTFPNITLAILENGQYNQDRAYIHTLPSQLPQIISDLNASRVLTVHHGKYALARHHRKDPLQSIYQASLKHNFTLLTPMIWEPLNLSSSEISTSQWRTDLP